MTDLLLTGPADAAVHIILAHGAGAPMDTPFMAFFAEALAARGHHVVRFEFPYMARRRSEGTRRPPDREPVLLEIWRAVIAEVRARFAPATLVIGGKSMGGRMASLIAAEEGAGEQRVDGLVVLGYPFHAAGKPGYAERRLGHLPGLAVPTLICQGTRDTLGGRDTVADIPLSPAITLHWLEDGDHSLKPRKASGRTEAQNLAEAAEAIDAFVRGLP
ncbi:alpha/beta family hydrolase [Novispirillum sp. DQ9]|uniref:alpha/beta family hydrolase n=1 Tax=Novispirillum sp. DQ9 TaxID=3398612 RepID=UPI003C798049